MEKKINSYYGMAYNDYCYAKAGMQVGEQLGNYNGVDVYKRQFGSTANDFA